MPTEPAFPADMDTLNILFAEDADYQFPFGQLPLNKALRRTAIPPRFIAAGELGSPCLKR
ncbi:hypothetical protein JW935_08580 [candidate division KSB1 bacterium]|nr:hypothetical protein [candidate division KSB1 bacterium]